MRLGRPRLPRGAIRSPNIWEHPQTYETENAAVDPDRVIEAALGELIDADPTPPAGRALGPRTWGDVLDVGCGSGYHLPRLARSATTVTGVEPHPALVAAATDRTRTLANVTVRQGTAQQLPVPDGCVDVAYARWAYFFGPGCEPGLRELARVCRRGALAVVLDHDATRSSLGRWFAAGLAADGIGHDPGEHERFWARHGFARRRLDVRWRFDSEADLVAVLRIEFPATVAEAALAEVTAARRPGEDVPWEVDAAVNLWHRRY